jgi:hypothetical protein
MSAIGPIHWPERENSGTGEVKHFVRGDRPLLRPSDAINYAGQDTGREHLSHSRIGILLACQRKYELHYEKRLERVDTPEGLELGKAFQLAVEHRDPGRGHDEIMRRADSLVGGQEDLDRLRVNATIVQAAARLYLDRWVEKCSACEGDGWVDNGLGEAIDCPWCEGTSYDQSERREMEYRVQLRSPWTGAYSRTFDLKGYADGVTYYLYSDDRPDHISLTENKLVGRITNTQVQKLVLDRQVTLACYGLWRATGTPVTEVNYRYVKKPAIKQKQTETIDQFLARLSADYEERPDFYAHEEKLYRTTEDLLRVEAELWMWAEDIRNLRRQRVYPRNTGSCDDYSGCQYLPICTNVPDHDSLYRVREPHDG